MHVSIEHIVTALGSLVTGGGGVYLFQHWIRRTDRKQDRNEERDREVVERLARIEAKVDHLMEFRADVKTHSERLTLTEKEIKDLKAGMKGFKDQLNGKGQP